VAAHHSQPGRPDRLSHFFTAFNQEFTMSLSERLAEYVRACFAGLWIQTHEQDEALHEIATLCRSQQWRLASWDIDAGLRVAGAETAADIAAGTDPLAAIRSLGTLAEVNGTTLLVLVNFHRFLHSAEIVQALARRISLGKQQRTFVVILAPVVQIPAELETLITVVEHPLPDRRDLAEIAQSVATEPGELPEGDAMVHVLDAAAGLTRFEAENIFSLALVRQGRIEPKTIWQEKCQTLKKSGLLQLHRGEESFGELGGLDALKSFCVRALRQRESGPSRARARGVLLLSPPGCGKSQFAKSLGNEVGRPTITLDVGTLMGSLVGESESRTRQALRTIDALAPAVVLVDEIEKALGGVTNSGQTDSGVSARMFGSLLSWLNDHTSDIFFIGTCNDISKLPPEFTRSERFDGIFFLDLPDASQRQAIWEIYLQQFALSANQPRPTNDDWTGAEIKACCRLAALLDCSLLEAAENIVPIARTATEAVSRLRAWADGRCLAADRPGIYRHQPNSKNGRSIRRDPAPN
jgi:hypothetical protein